MTLADPFLRRRLDAGELVAQGCRLRSNPLDLRPASLRLVFELRDPLVLLVVRVGLRSGLTGTPCESRGLAAPFVVLVGERRELAVALGEPLLGRRKLCPLLLELRVQDLLLGRRSLEPGRLLVRRCLRQSLEGLVGARQCADDSPSVALVALLDHRAKPGAEAGLGGELDPVLRGERVRGSAGDEAALDEGLAQAAAGPPAPRARARARRRSEVPVRRGGAQGDATECWLLPHPLYRLGHARSQGFVAPPRELDAACTDARGASGDGPPKRPLVMPQPPQRLYPWRWSTTTCSQRCPSGHRQKQRHLAVLMSPHSVARIDGPFKCWSGRRAPRRPLRDPASGRTSAARPRSSGARCRGPGA